METKIRHIAEALILIIIPDANTRFTSNEFKLKARRSVPTYTLTCNKHITDTQQGQHYTVHTRGIKAGRSILGN